jgi:hypothetical protein
MQIEQVQNLISEMDRATQYFCEADEVMKTDALEQQIIVGINRLICGVLGVPAKNESSLKKIDDVKAVVRKLINLIGITTILNEDELLDDGLKTAMADRAERLLTEVMEVQSVVSQPDLRLDSQYLERILERCNGGCYSHRSTGVRAGVLFNLMKANMGKCFTMGEFMEALKSCNTENHFGQLTKVTVCSAFRLLQSLCQMDETLHTTYCLLIDLGKNLSKDEPRFKMEIKDRR